MHFVPAVACGLLALSLQAAAARAADAGPSAPAPNPWVIGSAGTFALVEQFGYPWLVGLQYRAHPNNGTEALALWIAVPVRTGRWRARSGPGPAQGLYRGVSGATPLPGAGSCARYAESARLSSVE